MTSQVNLLLSESQNHSSYPSTLKRVTDFALASKPQEMPREALQAAAYLFLDTIGICVAAAPMDAGLIARKTATLLYSPGDQRLSARLLFDGRLVSLAGAIYAAATQIDNLDGHDGYNPTKGHIGVVTIPTLAAAAENLPDLTGPDALAALVIGYEVSGRAAISLHASVNDYHTSGAWNALGVATMLARLRGHSPETLRQALGIAEFHGPRSQMMREIANPTMLHDGSGWGALAGATAAILAEQGFTGAPAITLESDIANPHWSDLGDFWQVCHQYIKPYPTCRWAHAPVDAARELALAHALKAEDVSEVRIRSFNYAVELYAGHPETTSQAQYSLPFAVAVMLVHGRIGVEHISGDGLNDPEVARLVDATKLIADPRHEARYPLERWADLELVLADGRVLTSGDVHARGGPERPYSRQDIVDKYMEFAAPVLGDGRALALKDAILSLTDEGSAFADVSKHLYEEV